MASLAPKIPDAIATGINVIQTVGLPEWMSGSKEAAYITTIDTSTDDGFALAMRASLGKDRRLCDEVNMEIAIRSWIASPYDGIDEDTGEVVSAVRIALVDSEGVVHVTYSSGVKRSLILLAGRYGIRVWDPPVRVKVSSVPAKVGHTLFLSPVGATGETKAKKER